MDNQAIEHAIKSDLETLKTLRLETVSARDYYSSIVEWIFRLSLLFLGVNTVLQCLMHAIGYYLPTLSIQIIVVGWIFALFASLFMSFSAARIMLIRKMITGQLKTAVLLQQKFFQFAKTFFIIYSITYLMITFPVLGWMDPADFQPVQGDLFFTSITLAIQQFFSFVTASVATSFIAMAELERLGIAPVFNLITETIRKHSALHRSRP